MTNHFRKITTLVILFVILANVLGACAGETPTPPVVVPTPTTFPKTIDLIHKLTVTGNVVTSQQNCPQVMAGMTDGIVLGVDPQTCSISETQGTDATLDVNIPAEDVNNVFILKISWPNKNGLGLLANTLGATAQIRFDGNVIWEKSALVSSDNELLLTNFYYAAKSEPIILTFVPKTEGSHRINISVPAEMSWDIDTIQISMAPYPTNILGIAYSPYRDCQVPDATSQATDEDKQNIEADL